MARKKKETFEQAAAPKKSQAPALIASLILLLISGSVLLYVLRLSSGEQPKDTLDVLPTPERVRTDLDGFTRSDTEPPESIKTLKSYTDYYKPDGTPIAPAEGDDNPFL